MPRNVRDWLWTLLAVLACLGIVLSVTGCARTCPVGSYQVIDEPAQAQNLFGAFVYFPGQSHCQPIVPEAR